MDATTADIGLQRLTFTRKPDSLLTRVFDYKPFLVFLCICRPSPCWSCF